MTKRMTAIACGVLLVIGVAAAVALVTGPRYTATILGPDALTTDAPPAAVAAAIHAVYERVRLRHFMDSQGRARFEDGTSTDRKVWESARSTGDFVQGVLAFDDPAGNPITIKSYASPEFGTLVVWEYANGNDAQAVSVILQQALSRQAVTLRK